MNVSSSFFEKGRLNIVSPTAQWQPNLDHYPTINDWNTVFLNCLQNDSWETHSALHHFFQRWNKVLDEGWLRVLLSKNKYERNIVDSSFYKMHLNDEEIILILLLEFMLKTHPVHLQEEVRHRVQSISKAFKKTKQSLSAVFKAKAQNFDEGKKSNLRHLLKQSLYWRNTLPDDDSKKDPLLRFINDQTANGLPLCVIERIEIAMGEDLKLSALFTTECITALIIYLLAGKHKNLDLQKILHENMDGNHDGDNPTEVLLNSSQGTSNQCENNMEALGRSFEELSLEAQHFRPVQMPYVRTEYGIWEDEMNNLRASFEELTTNVIAQIQPPISYSEKEAAFKSLAVITEDTDSLNRSSSGIDNSQSNGTDASISTQEAEASQNIISVIQKKRGGNTTQRCFKNRETHIEAINILTKALQKEKGWVNAVVLADVPEFFNMITVHQVVKIQRKLTLLKHAVVLAFEDPNKTWENILEATVKHFDYENLGTSMLGKIFCQFNDKNHKFKLPHPDSRNVDSKEGKLKHKMDHFILNNQDMKLKFLSFARENLRGFSVDKMHNFANTELMQELKEEIRRALREKDGEPESEEEEKKKVNECIRKQYGFQNGTISRTTVYSWIRMLEFNYSLRKKQYFVDRHEDHKTHRTIYIQKRLDDEIHQPVWVQISASQFRDLKNDGTLSSSIKEYTYQNEDGKDMVEFHIDCDKGDAILRRLENSLYGGYFSVRRPQNNSKVILFGHDEAIMKQNQFTPRAWVMGDGTAILTPKTEGAGVMYSLLVSRATGAGFGAFWNDEIKQKTNLKRSGQHYFDREAAIAVHGKSLKDPLLTDPANRKFSYGGANGWWTGNHLLVQVEDFLDVFFEAFENITPLLLFDNSTGHSKGRMNGLNVNNMNKNYGGKQQKLHPSVITANCLGPYSPKLRPGDTQRFTFEEGDEGPFYLEERTRAAKKYDFLGKNKKPKPLTISELTEKLIEKGINVGKRKKPELVELAKLHGIPLDHPPENIREGWLGKAKGMLQVAYERGKINPARWSEYQVDAPCDALGVKNTALSLRDILASCEDFQNEKSQLEFVIEELGGSCQMSPKYHPEIAGEGIEYLWGYVKKLYRVNWSIREAKDQKEADFLRLIDGIMDGSDGKINATVVRKSARRARDYMLAYRLIQKEQEKQERQVNGGETNCSSDDEEKNEDIEWGVDKISMSYALIEKVVKQIRSKKTHRAPRDLDTAFVNNLGC